MLAKGVELVLAELVPRSGLMARGVEIALVALSVVPGLGLELSPVE